ncbi:MAG: tetratricopeptide repeat protein [Candidatus Promineifilaceae bacterium]
MSNPIQLLRQAAAAARRNEYMQAIQLYTDLLAETDPHSDEPAVQDARLLALRERGRLFHIQGENQAALAGYEQYLLEAGDGRQAIDALVLIGQQCSYMNRFERAIDAHRQALELAEKHGDTPGRAKALGGLGLVFSYLERPEEALSYLRRSLALFEQMGDKDELARCWNRIGVAQMSLGELDKAILAFRASSELAQLVGEGDPLARETLINALSNLGECYQYLFDMQQALDSHRRALQMAERTLLPYFQADLARNLGVDLEQLGQPEEGIAFLYRSLQLSVETGQPDVEVQALYSLALAEWRRGEADKARALADGLKAKAEESRNQGAQADALYVLGLCHQSREEAAAAERSWQQALFLAHETGRRMLLWQLHSALAAIAPNPELAGVHNRIAAEIIQQIAHPIEDQQLRGGFLQAPAVKAILDQVSVAE